jgi:ribosomal 50S subunit-recycling heat shock protein
MNAGRMRIDKWLWHARFCKTRTLATGWVMEGHLRVNGARVVKASHSIAQGDVLTLPQDGGTRLIRILAVGVRRGPAAEARLLYLDLDAPAATSAPLE